VWGGERGVNSSTVKHSHEAFYFILESALRASEGRGNGDMGDGDETTAEQQGEREGGKLSGKRLQGKRDYWFTADQYEKGTGARAIVPRKGGGTRAQPD